MAKTRSIPRYREESPGVFSLRLYQPQECKSIVGYLLRLRGWSAAEVRQETGEGSYNSIISPDTRSASILDPGQAGKLHRDFDDKMAVIVQPLIRQIWSVELTEHSGTQILRYLPGGHYLVHRDAGMDLDSRYFTVVCYWNDDFEGGHTSFPSLNYSAVPRSGKAILFPSRYYHCAEPVIRGEKFVIVSWVHGPVPIRWI